MFAPGMGNFRFNCPAINTSYMGKLDCNSSFAYRTLTKNLICLLFWEVLRLQPESCLARLHYVWYFFPKNRQWCCAWFSDLLADGVAIVRPLQRVIQVRSDLQEYGLRYWRTRNRRYLLVFRRIIGGGQKSKELSIKPSVQLVSEPPATIHELLVGYGPFLDCEYLATASSESAFVSNRKQSGWKLPLPARSLSARSCLAN
jgi:hypothetical protein